MRNQNADHRRWVQMLLAAAAVVLILAPGIAGAGAGTGGDTDDDARMVADAKLAESAIVAGYNDKKWDELRTLYSEDALLLPPNHEPVQGRDAIIEYFQSIRDVTGEIDDGLEYLRAKGSGNFAVLAGKITIQSGRVRMTYNDLYERQPDGSVLLAVNQIAFREQAAPGQTARTATSFNLEEEPQNDATKPAGVHGEFPHVRRAAGDEGSALSGQYVEEGEDALRLLREPRPARLLTARRPAP